jgi:hypothetical protein
MAKDQIPLIRRFEHAGKTVRLSIFEPGSMGSGDYSKAIVCVALTREARKKPRPRFASERPSNSRQRSAPRPDTVPFELMDGHYPNASFICEFLLAPAE